MDRLSRFFKLVRNEYIKIFKKGGTIGLLIIMTVLVIGFEALTCYDSDDYQTHQRSCDYSDDIGFYSRRTDETARQITEMYKYLEEKQIPHGTWKADISGRFSSRAYNQNKTIPKEQLDKVYAFFDSDDWEGCYSYLLTLDETRPEDKAEFELRIKHGIPVDSNDHRSDLIIDIVAIQQAALGGTKGEPTQKQKDKIAILEYQIDNDIAYNVARYSLTEAEDGKNTWNVWVFSAYTVYIAAVVIMIFAGNIVANEYSQGTIKFLLVNPVKRWKILLSKLFTILSLAVIFFVVLFLLCGAMSALFVGSNGLDAAWLTAENGVVTRSSALLYVLIQWLYVSVTLFVMAILSFSLSTFARKSSIAIALSICVMLVGSGITQLLAGLGFDWGRFLLFANLDLSGIASGNTLFYRQNVGFAVFVIVEHIIVFLVTAFDSFRKKEI